MKIEVISISELKPASYNPRTIDAVAFEGLKKSIELYGQVENLIVNEDMTVISGHQRLQAMQVLGYKEASCLVLTLSKEEEKKLNLVMNSQAISGDFDELLLSEVLEELKLDKDYEPLLLKKLEPLDLSDKDTGEPKLTTCPECGHEW